MRKTEAETELTLMRSIVEHVGSLADFMEDVSTRFNAPVVNCLHGVERPHPARLKVSKVVVSPLQDLCARLS